MTIIRFLQKNIVIILLVLCCLLLIKLAFTKELLLKLTKKEAMTHVKIPKVIMQTSKEEAHPQNIEKLMALAPGWTYKHYTDDEIIEYFKENPLEECRNIIEKFYSIKKGAHRADLFRYYYLYIEGGVFIDSDAMIVKDLNDIVKDYEFFTVNSTEIRETPAMFQGFIGCTAKNKIMYEALMDAYHTEPFKLVENYFLFCENIYTFIQEDKNYRTKIFYERELENRKVAETYDKETGEVILKHYFVDKVIP